jgi:hypothetical protein
MASITLPRPSRKDNLANVVAPIPVNSVGQKVAEQGGGKRKRNKKNEGEYRGTYSRDWNSAVLAYGLYGGLSGNKRSYRDKLQLPSKQSKIRERISNQLETNTKHNPADESPPRDQTKKQVSKALTQLPSFIAGLLL